MSFIEDILEFIVNIFTEITSTIRLIVSNISETLKLISSTFTRFPLIISRLGVIADSYLWFLPEPVRFMMYAGVFALLLYAVISLAIRILKK